jgi:hypothetical protein
MDAGLLELIGSRPSSRLGCQSNTAGGLSHRQCHSEQLRTNCTLQSSRQADRDNFCQQHNRQQSPVNKATVGKSKHVVDDEMRTTRRRRNPKRESVASYVDESLFASVPINSVFHATCTQHSVSDCSNYKISTSRQQQTSARPTSSRKLYNRSASFVDESLFGSSQLEPPCWPAPWQKKESRPRPLLFDTRDLRVTVEHPDINSTKRPTQHNICTDKDRKPAWH